MKKLRRVHDVCGKPRSVLLQLLDRREDLRVLVHHGQEVRDRVETVSVLISLPPHLAVFAERRHGLTLDPRR